MTSAYIVDAVRTPMGRFGGVLASVRPDDMAAHVIASIVSRNAIPGADVEDVVWGAANQAGEDDRNVARMALLLAGLPVSVPGATVNRLCGSGLEAVNSGSRQIVAGEGDVVIAGGSESMTQAPFVMPDAMGNMAENVAEEWGVTRHEQDEFALRSHQRAIEARDAGRFEEEVVPVEILRRKGDPVVIDHDEPPLPDTSRERLGSLKSVVTAGNSSGVNDGAASVLLASKGGIERHEWTPMARVVATEVTGVEPRVMGIGPVLATRKALERSGLSVADIDLVELNEAFAAQSIACVRELGLDMERVNVNGGAIALGHPLGCSGARILTTLLYEMRRREVRYGLATMCIGVGHGIATIVERV